MLFAFIFDIFPVGRDELVLALTDKVFPARLDKGFYYHSSVLGAVVLQQSPLRRLVFTLFGDKHGLERIRVKL